MAENEIQMRDLNGKIQETILISTETEGMTDAERKAQALEKTLSHLRKTIEDLGESFDVDKLKNSMGEYYDLMADIEASLKRGLENAKAFGGAYKAIEAVTKAHRLEDVRRDIPRTEYMLNGGDDKYRSQAEAADSELFEKRRAHLEELKNLESSLASDLGVMYANSLITIDKQRDSIGALNDRTTKYQKSLSDLHKWMDTKDKTASAVAYDRDNLKKQLEQIQGVEREFDKASTKLYRSMDDAYRNTVPFPDFVTELKDGLKDASIEHNEFVASIDRVIGGLQHEKTEITSLDQVLDALWEDLGNIEDASDAVNAGWESAKLQSKAGEIGVSTEQYQAVVDKYKYLGKDAASAMTTEVDSALDKSTRRQDSILRKNLGSISSDFKKMFSMRHAGYGENKADVTSAVNIGTQMVDSFKNANDKILKNAQDLKNRASKIYSSIPDAVKRTSSGTIVNQVAMDAAKAYAEVGTLVSKLEKIPDAVKSTKEYDALSKQLTKLQDDYDKAFQKRSMFVLQTNDTALKSFDNFERQIREKTELLHQYQDRLTKLQAMLKKDIPSGSVDGMLPNESSIKETKNSIKQVERELQRLYERQQFYAQNRADATLKREYDTYSYKLVTINQQLEETRQKMADLQAQGGVSNLADKMQEADSIVGEINTKLKELGKLSKEANKEQRLLGRSAQGLGDKYRGVEAPAGFKKTEQFKEYEKGYRAAYKALQNLYELEKQYIASGKSTDSTAWTNLATRIDSAKSKLADYNKYMEQAIANGDAFVSKQASKKNWIDLRWSDVFGSGWGKVFGDAMKAASNSFKKTTSITFGALKKMLEGIWSLVPKIGKGIKDWAKNQKSLGDSAKQMYKTFTGYLSMLRTRIRRKFVSMVFEDLQNNIKALAKMSPRLNKAISDFVVGTKTLGAQIVAAFEPLVAKVLPYITMFVDYLTYAAQQMSQFISQLFGDDTWIKAVKGQYNFAESVDNSTSSTKKATKAAKEYENTVLSFDELHKLNGNDSGSEEDADGLTGVDLKYAELEANKLMEIARKINKALSEGDFYGAGKAMGEGVNEAFAWLRDTAGWSKNADKFTKWAENAINLVNGLIDGIDGLANGQAIGDVINSVINIADKLTDPEAGIHFYEAGKTLGETFVSALLEIDWDTAGRALMNGLQGIAKGVTGFLTAEVYTMKNKTTGETRYARKDETGRPVWNDGTVVDPNEWNIEEDAMTGAQALGRGLHKMFSEAVKTFNVDTWSDLVASLVNEFFTFIGELFSEPEKAAEFGRKVGQLINETFEKINAEDVAGGINNFVASLTAFFESAFDETDWSGIFSKFKEIGELVDWAPIGKIIGVAMAPGLVTGLFSAVGSLVKTLGTAWIVSKILGIGGAGAAGGAAAGGAGLLGWLGAGAKTVGSILLGSYAGVGWSEFLGQVTNGKLGISEEHANKFYQDPFGGIGKTIQADLLGLKQMVGDIAGNVFGAEWGKDWYNSATQGLQAISDKVNGVQESVDAMNSDEFNTMWSQMKDEMYGDDAKLMNMDGQTFLDNATTSIPSLTLPADGSVLSSAPTEDFRNGLAEEVGAAFFDALTKTAGDVVMVVNGNEIGRVAMNYMAKYNKQYLATKPAVV